MVDRPTMQTVAIAAGVSRMTVSNAYNRPDQLTADTRERVLQTASALGYPGPDPAAQSLRRKSTGTIAVVLTSRLTEAFIDPGLVMILHGIASQLSDAGARCYLCRPARPRVRSRSGMPSPTPSSCVTWWPTTRP